MRLSTQWVPVLEVCQFYYLHRSITLTTWTQVQEELKTQAPSPENPNGYPDMLLKHRHVEFLWDPYERDGEHAVAQMTWDIIPQPTSCDGNIASAGVECVPEFIGELLDRIEECQFLYTITAIIFNLFPSATPWLVSMALKSQVGERRGTYYNMLLLHTAENAGFASELVFPVQQNTQKDAKIPSPFNCWPLPRNAGLWTLENVQSGIKTIAADVKLRVNTGGQFVTSPMGIRFVKRCSNYLSMMYGSDVCTIELDMAYGTWGATDLMHQFEFHRIRESGARFHWGLNFEGFESDLLPWLYPRLGDFRAQKKMPLGSIFSVFPFLEARA